MFLVEDVDQARGYLPGIVLDPAQWDEITKPQQGEVCGDCLEKVSIVECLEVEGGY